MRTVAQVDEYPAYLDALEIGDERAARKRIEELQAELTTLAKALEDARRVKKILYVPESRLRTELIAFMKEDLGLKAWPEGEQNLFWLEDANGDSWCVGEVRASEDGVQKEHLAHLMVERMRAGKPETTATLLVVNSHRGGATMEERDQPVPEEVVRRAVEDHIVVLRTLDLVRLERRASNGLPAIEQLADVLLRSGGWFEVDASFNAKLHGPPAPGVPPQPSAGVAAQA
jgi:hypothetical protein